MSEIHRFDRIPSTQAEGRKRAVAGAPVGTTLVAAEQDRGEGRAGHAWASPPGGLYFSRLVREPKAGSTLVALAVMLGLRKFVMERYGMRTQIRWPNDLWALPGPPPGGKVAGVVVDRVERSPAGVLVVGLGVNANTPRAQYPEELRDRVACLHDWAEGEVDLEELEEECGRIVDEAVQRLDEGDGPRGVVEEARQALEGVGRRVRIDGRAAGVVRGLADDGTLLTEDDAGAQEHHAGTLEYEPESSGPGPAT